MLDEMELKKEKMLIILSNSESFTTTHYRDYPCINCGKPRPQRMSWGQGLAHVKRCDCIIEVEKEFKKLFPNEFLP